MEFDLRQKNTRFLLREYGHSDTVLVPSRIFQKHWTIEYYFAPFSNMSNGMDFRMLFRSLLECPKQCIGGSLCPTVRPIAGLASLICSCVATFSSVGFGAAGGARHQNRFWSATPKRFWRDNRECARAELRDMTGGTWLWDRTIRRDSRV